MSYRSNKDFPQQLDQFQSFLNSGLANQLLEVAWGWGDDQYLTGLENDFMKGNIEQVTDPFFFAAKTHFFTNRSQDKTRINHCHTLKLQNYEGYLCFWFWDISYKERIHGLSHLYMFFLWVTPIDPESDQLLEVDEEFYYKHHRK